MSPGYDINDEERVDLFEDGKKGNSERGTAEDLHVQRNDSSSREAGAMWQGFPEKITADAIHGDPVDKSERDNVMISDKDNCCSGRGRTAVGSRKRPHPDSKW